MWFIKGKKSNRHRILYQPSVYKIALKENNSNIFFEETHVLYEKRYESFTEAEERAHWSFPQP